MTTLFVTSFARDMYRTTGVHLVKSFLSSATEGQLLICHEGGMQSELAGRSQKLLYYDLDDSRFLKTWLHEHRGVIPQYLGGEATPCDCGAGADPLSVPHRPRCVFDWFNRNASRWFRKIVSLDFALSLEAGAAIVWIDSDCRFVAKLPGETVDAVFGDHAAFFLKGPGRPAIESGVIGFRRTPAGVALLTSVVERYRSGRFKLDDRWDDGYQFTRAFAGHPPELTVDIGVPDGSPDSVLASSALGPFITHYKGVHGPVLRLMV